MVAPELPPFYPAAAAVPDRLEAADFALLPLTPAHVELDYAALMESREMLRLWSGGPWPQGDFTLEDNRGDLEWHDEEHRQRIAFTYTVLDPAESHCLGCVYIKPLAGLVANQSDNPERLPEIGPYEAAVRFWITAPRLLDQLDKRLLGGLRSWFKQEWAFRRVLFHTREANERQLRLFAEAELQYVWRLTMPQRGGEHQFWE